MNHKSVWTGFLAGIMLMLIGAIPVGATQCTWVDPQASPDRNWSTTTNWSGNVLPGTADEAYFSSVAGPWYQYHPVWVDVNPTISNFYLHGGAAGNSTFIFSNDTARITMTRFTYDWTWQFPVAMYPSVTVNGPFTATRALPGNAGPGKLTFYTGANEFHGGMDVGWHYVAVNGDGNTFNNGLRVSGFQDGVLLSGLLNDNMGRLEITGSGNTFGTGQFIMDYKGNLTLVNSSDLSLITNYIWTGGTLQLGNAGGTPLHVFASLANGFNVTRGTILMPRESAMGQSPDPVNILQLGSRGGWGQLSGGAASDTNGVRIDRPIVLNGNGGIINPMTYGWGDWIYMSSPISGSGELIKLGFYWDYANGADTTVNASTYSGGTRIIGGEARIHEYRTLGTGNVVLDNGSVLRLYSSTNVAPGARIYVGQVGVGGVAEPAFLLIAAANAANAAYTIDTNSTGMLYIDNITTGPAFEDWIGSFDPGFLRIGGYGVYRGTNMAPGADNTYRLVGINNVSDAWNMDASGTTEGALVGDNNVEIGFPSGMRPAAVQFWDNMSYTGTTTVHRNSYLMAYAGTGTGNPYGSNTNAPVILDGGRFELRQGIAGKGDLFFQGSAIFDAWVPSTFIVRSLNRVNYVTLCMFDNSTNTLGGGGKIQVLFPPVPTNGMVTPYMIGQAGVRGTNFFLNYVEPNGFTNANFTQTSSGPNFPGGLSGGTDIVNIQGVSTLQDNPDIYALRTENAVTANGANNTITLGSGGLILNGEFYTNDVNWVCPDEMLVYVDSTAAGNAVTLSGTISASRLTVFGDGTYPDGYGRWGFLKLTGDNSSTITGPITVNKANLLITASTALGPANNDLILNGGSLYNMAASEVYVTQNVKIGPLGGRVYGYGARLSLWNVSDLEPGNSGPLYMYWASEFKGTNTWTGGLIINGECRFDTPTALPFSLGNGPVRVMNGSIGIYPSTNGNLTIPSRLTLQYPQSWVSWGRGGTLRVGSIEGLGNIQLGNPYSGNSGTPPVLIVGMDNTDSDFYGTWYSDADWSRGVFVKEGTGTLTVWNRVWHGGETFLSNGTLCVNGEIAMTNMVTVKSGATLAGKGYLYAPVTVEAGGNLEGSLAFVTNVTLGADVNYNVTLTGTNAVSEFGQIVMYGGILDLSGATLNLTLANLPLVGQQFMIVNNQGGSIVNEFASRRVVTGTYGGRTYYFSIAYNGGDGDDIVLTALPAGTLLLVN